MPTTENEKIPSYTEDKSGSSTGSDENEVINMWTEDQLHCFCMGLFRKATAHSDSPPRPPEPGLPPSPTST